MVGVAKPHSREFPVVKALAMVSRRVDGFVRGRDVLMWSAEDVVWVRREWRVVGSLVGALPLHPRQNSQLGLPLILQPEETTLLREKGVLELWQYTPPSLSDKDCQLFQELRAQDVQEQQSTYQSQRERFSLKRKHHSSEEEEAASKKEMLDTCLLEASEEHATEGGNAWPSKSHDNISHTGEVGPSEPCGDGGEHPHNKGFSFSPHVCIHTADPRTKYCPHCFRCAEWLFPGNRTETLRYRVFSDLWRKGYYLTNGLKYGGDYLVYPGDPALVHSHYVAVVLPWQRPIPSLASLGRLGSKVKKNVLLCSEDVHGDLRYFTLQWSGLS